MLSFSFQSSSLPVIILISFFIFSNFQYLLNLKELEIDTDLTDIWSRRPPDYFRKLPNPDPTKPLNVKELIIDTSQIDLGDRIIDRLRAKGVRFYFSKYSRQKYEKFWWDHRLF